MKYFIIFKHSNNPMTVASYPSYIVENEIVAKHFCDNNHEFYYVTIDTQVDGNVITETENKQIDQLFDDNCFQPKSLYSGIKCPHCGASHFTVDYATVPAIHVPTVIKDGKIISSSLSVFATEHCTCLNCHKSFQITGGEAKK